jgi:hypothetical protein
LPASSKILVQDKAIMKISARSVSAALLLILILCIGISILEVQTKFFHRAYDEIILDNRNHYLSCNQLPLEVEVRRMVEEHQDVIKRIEQINPGFVGVEMDTTICPGKADILIWYGTHEERLLIENIIARETFYGIPYRLENR